jgi:hypothetical protein
MQSPFPGMDPYLESHWRDVHARLIIHTAERLQEKLPGDLRARVEERVFVESPQGVERSVYSDVRVVERFKKPTAAQPSESGVAVAEPLIIHVPDEPVSEGYIEIREAGTGGRVITVIELISLANKLPGEGQNLYRQKQRELKDGCVSLVEIDLLRAGRRILAIPPESIPPSYRTTYQVCVRCSWRPAAIEVYRVPLRERLPVFPVPLRQTDDDVLLDLQLLLERCYVGGGYDDLDYTAEPNPPLDPPDAAWADDLLREKGLRSS